MITNVVAADVNQLALVTSKIDHYILRAVVLGVLSECCLNPLAETFVIVLVAAGRTPSNRRILASIRQSGGRAEMFEGGRLHTELAGT